MLVIARKQGVILLEQCDSIFDDFHLLGNYGSQDELLKLGSQRLQFLFLHRELSITRSHVDSYWPAPGCYRKRVASPYTYTKTPLRPSHALLSLPSI